MSIKKTFFEVEEQLPSVGPKRSASWSCGDRPLVAGSFASAPAKPCVFFGTRLGCRDGHCGFQHVALTSPAQRPRKSTRDSYKQAVEKAFLIKAHNL